MTLNIWTYIYNNNGSNNNNNNNNDTEYIFP